MSRDAGQCVRWREARREGDDDDGEGTCPPMVERSSCVVLMLLAAWAALLLSVSPNPNAAMLELSTPTSPRTQATRAATAAEPLQQLPPTRFDLAEAAPIAVGHVEPGADAVPPSTDTHPLPANAQPLPAPPPPCPGNSSARQRSLAPAAGDWTFVADAAGASDPAVQFRFARAATWVDGSGAVGHLISRLSGGCINLRPGDQVRGHSNMPPHETAAQPSASTEMRRSLTPARVSAEGAGCTSPPVARFEFTSGGGQAGGQAASEAGDDRVFLAGSPSGELHASRQCEDAMCDFELLELPPAAADEHEAAAEGASLARWFALRSVWSGRLLRLSHAALTQPASWEGIRTRARRKRGGGRRPAGGWAGGAKCHCPVSGGPPGWAHNCTEWAPLIRKYLAAWSMGNVSQPRGSASAPGLRPRTSDPRPPTPDLTSDPDPRPGH